MTGARRIAARCYGVAGVLAGLGLAWAVGLSRVPPAAAAQPAADAPGTLAFTSAGPSGAQWLYLIDTKTQAFAVYRIDPQSPKGAVKLEAARQYRWDLKLAEYNNQPPEVAAIESMVANPRR
jgi:hypothetical protein